MSREKETRQKLRLLLPVLLLLSVAGGCAKVTDNDPVTFLRLQLMQAPPGLSDAGWSAEYAGRKGGHHIIVVRWSNYMTLPLLWEGAFHEEKHRCPVSSLPEGFPKDFAQDLASQEPRYWNDQLRPTTYYQFPRIEVVDQAIREYLQKHGKLTPELEEVLQRKPRLTAKPTEIRY